VVANPPAASAKRTDSATDWASFDKAVGSAFGQMQNVGGAVAVVSADAVLHTATFGSRTLQGRKPVTVNTRFAVGSTTKAMTAALVATYVDQKMSRPGESGDFEPWEGWSHARRDAQAVSA
jgi:CubicO group peptidase (beta-lactamase class C family)